MALLSDIEDDDQEQQETFDRISGILSSLIQEANEAVNGIEQERVHLLKKKSSSSTSRKASKTPRVFTSSTIITNHSNDHSKIPRPRKLRASNTPSVSHVRHGSNTSSSSTSSINTSSALFSPISTSTSATLSRSPSPTLSTFKKQLFRHHTVLRPRSCPVIQAPTKRASMTPQHKKNNSSNLILVTDPITESFKRLDTSMALVDSLSRDLATPTPTKSNRNNNSNGLTFLLLVPLLHIPHSLITMIFDFCFSSTPSASGHANISNAGHVQLISRSTSTSSFSLSSMIFWACVFAVTNLMVDQVAVIPKKYLSTITKVKSVRRMSLPGTYHSNNNNHNNSNTTSSSSSSSSSCSSSKKKSSKVPPVVPLKRTWIPATIQQQYAFRIGDNELLPLPQKRRNSI